MEQNVTIKLTGTRPLLLHNGRLADPLDSWTRKLKTLTSTRKKTDEIIFQIAMTEARGGMYETERGTIAFPNDNARQAIKEGAKLFKLGKAVDRALHVIPENVPILIDGKEHDCDEWLNSDPDKTVFRKAARVGISKPVRSRAIIPAGWSITVTFTLLADVLDMRTLTPAIHASGRLIGIGDWRPIYGLYDVEIV